MKNVLLLISLLINASLIKSQSFYTFKIKFPIESSVKANYIKIPFSINFMRTNISVSEKNLILTEPEQSPIFSIFDLPSCSFISKFGTIGTGSNQFSQIDSKSVQVTNKGLKIFDVKNGFVFVDLINLIRDNYIVASTAIRIPGVLYPLNDAIYLNDSIICGLPYAGIGNKLYVKYNYIKNKINYFGEYPKIYSQKFKSQFWITFDRETIVKPDHTRFASFGRLVKMYQIYSADLSLIEEQIMEYQSNLFEDGQIRINPRLYYTSVKATNEFIYALIQNSPKNDSNNSTLEVWNWDGEPIAKIITDHHIYEFDVAIDNKKIFFIDSSMSNAIFTLNLSNHLHQLGY